MDIRGVAIPNLKWKHKIRARGLGAPPKAPSGCRAKPW